jgi:hypothetical protein
MRCAFLHLLWTALVLALGSVGHAQIEITGMVMYKGKPLQDGYLYCDTTEAYTDSLGRFAITVDSLGSDLYVGLFGYESMVYTVSRSGHHVIDLPRRYGRRSRRMMVCGFCFTGDVRVTMGDGSCRAIDEVGPGDLVMALGGEVSTAVNVLRVDSAMHEDLIKLELVDGRGVICTADHPLPVVGKGLCAVRPSIAQQRMGVRPLLTGDRCLVLKDGGLEEVVVREVVPVPGARMTYNLTTEQGTYFANGILVSDERAVQRFARNGIVP